MNRARKSTEEFLNPWASASGWKVRPDQFQVITPQKRTRRYSDGNYRPIKRRMVQHASFGPNILQVTTALLSFLAFGLFVYLLTLVFQ